MDACEGFPDIAVNGRVALVQGCAYALWDLKAGRWAEVEPGSRDGQGRIVVAGPVYLIAGASHGSSANGLAACRPG
jgi:hypothetical protein